VLDIQRMRIALGYLDGMVIIIPLNVHCHLLGMDVQSYGIQRGRAIRICIGLQVHHLAMRGERNRYSRKER
jgi:hypothetical protein